jgi:hypothetical protein
MYWKDLFLYDNDGHILGNIWVNKDTNTCMGIINKRHGGGYFYLVNFLSYKMQKMLLKIFI